MQNLFLSQLHIIYRDCEKHPLYHSISEIYYFVTKNFTYDFPGAIIRRVSVGKQPAWPFPVRLPALSICPNTNVAASGSNEWVRQYNSK